MALQVEGGRAEADAEAEAGGRKVSAVELEVERYGQVEAAGDLEGLEVAGWCRYKEVLEGVKVSSGDP